jgi:Na+-transporting NADH:ubiquinone oxidoreductase subunit NqrC
MRGNFGISHPNDTAALFLKFKAHQHPTAKKGETMTTQAIQKARYPVSRHAQYPVSRHAQRMQDVFLVSSFGLWAVLLGLSPVLAFRLLMGG